MRISNQDRNDWRSILDFMNRAMSCTAFLPTLQAISMISFSSKLSNSAETSGLAIGIMPTFGSYMSHSVYLLRIWFTMVLRLTSRFSDSERSTSMMLSSIRKVIVTVACLLVEESPDISDRVFGMISASRLHLQL